MRESWSRLKAQAEAIQSFDARASDVLWPLFHYSDLDIELFDSSTMCLLADDVEGRLRLNERMISDIHEQIPSPATGVTWFWTHQMVHVTQGLTYKTFRELNTEPDRIETTRADVWADFISLKTLAIFELLDRCGGDQCDTDAIRNRQLALFHDVVWPMVKMRPNYFVPFEREFEVRRVLSLIVLGLLLDAIALTDGPALVDDAVFVNWRAGTPGLYIWYGQTSLLGRKPIPCSEAEIQRIIAAIQGGHYDEAYDRVQTLPLPRGAELEDFLRRRVP